MCEPTTIAIGVAAVSALSTGVTLYQQQQNANTQQDALDDSAQTAADEAAESASNEAGIRVREARKEAARRLVAQGESGLAGVSMFEQVSDPYASLNQDLATLQRQKMFDDRANNNQYRNASASIDRVSGLEFAAGVGSSAAGGYASGLQIGGVVQENRRRRSGKV